MAKKTILDYFGSQGPAERAPSDSLETFAADDGAQCSDPPRKKVCQVASESEEAHAVPCENVFNDGAGVSKIRATGGPEVGRAVAGKDSAIGKRSTVHDSAQDATDDVLDFNTNSVLCSDPGSRLGSNFSFLGEEDAGPAREQVRYAFMTDVRDARGTRRGEEGYDPTTLYIPEECFKRFTPFERQFWAIKKNHFDTVIMFKKGMFYELYEEDAELAARLFDLRIADRVNMKMAGFPERRYDAWAPRFLELGYKIGRVEQAESAIGKELRERSRPARAATEKIISRELREIITAGTNYNGEFMSSPLPFYLAVVVEESVCCCAHDTEGEGGRLDSLGAAAGCSLPNHFSALLYDASINKIYIRSFGDHFDLGNLKTIFVQNDVRELVTDLDMALVTTLRPARPGKASVAVPQLYDFPTEGTARCYSILHSHMSGLCRGDSLNGAEVCPLGGTGSLALDGATLTNLDILRNNYDDSSKHSLFSAVNYCTTPFGTRLLQRWLVNPLSDPARIEARRSGSALFVDSEPTCLITALSSLGDAERCAGRLCNANVRARDLAAFIKCVERCCAFLDGLLSYFRAGKKRSGGGTADIPSAGFDLLNEGTILSCTKSLRDFLDDFSAAYSIDEEEVRPGALNGELAKLAAERTRIEGELAALLSGLKTRTGLPDLVFRSVNKDLFTIEARAEAALPPEFTVVSVTKTHRRYYSPALRSLVKEFQEAEERIFQAQGSLLRQAVASVAPHKTGIDAAISFIATVDCYISFSVFNRTNETSVPVFLESGNAVVRGLRSPVFPRHVRNDYTPRHRITLVAGPNMGGKSTFLRSVCLNIILAQVGMGVLAEHMEIPVFDRIFTRIGAADSLARGESTFCTELAEAARILRGATSRSFVVVDELGRGTATEDGAAIARAVLDALARTGCHALFATHYHTLTADYALADKAYLDCVVDGRDIVFLYKVRSGLCTESHGLHVARMAGVPDPVIDRAHEIRRGLIEEDR